MTTYADQAFQTALNWHQREMESNYSAEDFDDSAGAAGLVDECPYDEDELALEKAENVVASLDSVNELLCQSLRDKIHSYPASKAYSATAYENTLKKVEALEVSVLDLPTYKWHQLGDDSNTGIFICDWMETLVRECDEAYLVLADCPEYADARAKILVHADTRAKADHATSLM